MANNRKAEHEQLHVSEVRRGTPDGTQRKHKEHRGRNSNLRSKLTESIKSKIGS